MQQRPIKFRVWNALTKKMDCDVFLAPSGKPIYPDSVEYDFPVMQFTGLLDKNGKEIYEGDILTHDDGRIQAVTLHFNAFDGFFVFTHELEIIGNIHENPELLDPDNQLYDPAKDPSLEKEEHEPIPF